ncbi:hypothetical protein D3C80_1716660 [compost metagenome]
MNAIDPRGFVAIARQHLQGRQHQQRDKRHGLPDVDDDHRPHRQVRIGRPGQGRVYQAEAQHQVIDDAELVVKHP